MAILNLFLWEIKAVHIKIAGRSLLMVIILFTVITVKFGGDVSTDAN